MRVAAFSLHAYRISCAYGPNGPNLLGKARRNVLDFRPELSHSGPFRPALISTAGLGVRGLP